MLLQFPFSQIFSLSLAFSVKKILLPKIFTRIAKDVSVSLLFLLVQNQKLLSFLKLFEVEYLLKSSTVYPVSLSLHFTSRLECFKDLFYRFFHQVKHGALCAYSTLSFSDFPSSKPGLHSRTDSKE